MVPLGTAGDDAADKPTFHAEGMDHASNAFRMERADHQHESDAHIEDAVHFIRFDIAEPLQPREHGRHGPAIAVDQHA